MKFLCKIFGHKFYSKKIALKEQINYDKIDMIVVAGESTDVIFCKRCKKGLTINEYKKMRLKK